MLDVLDLTAGRPAGDVLSRVVRVSIGGAEYELPVLSMKGNREWRANLTASTSALLDGLNAADDDLSGIFAILSEQTETLVDLLLAYDVDHVLPSKDEIDAIRPDCSEDIVAAVREVWRAANPLVATSLRAMATPDSDSSPPTNTPAPRTATARRKSSRKN